MIARLDKIVGALPAYRRPMFGTTSWFLDANAQMFASVWGDNVTVRVGGEEAARLIASKAARPFEPMAGRPMSEYVAIDPSTLRDADLRKWVVRAAAFAEGLAAKKG